MTKDAISTQPKTATPEVSATVSPQTLAPPMRAHDTSTHKDAPNASPQNSGATLAVSTKNRAIFFRQFATLTKSGVSLGAALHHLAGEAPHELLREGARKAQICVEGGGRLSAWMRTRPQLFTRADCVLVYAGETSGNIPEMLDRIARDLEDELALKRRLFLATFISKYIVLPLLVLVPGISNFMIYGLDGLARRGGASLNEGQQQRVIFEEGLKGYLGDLWPRLIVAALLVVGYLFLKQLLPLTARGRKIHDQIALWIPGVGRLWRERAVSRFLLALSSLTNAGLTAPAALEACKGIADNAVLDERLEIVAQNARRANLPLPEALSQTGLLSNNALRLIKTGERSGASPEMLLRAANEYDQNLQNGLTSVPKIIGVSVFVVCGIATAVILGLALNLLYSNMFIGVEKYMEMK